MAMPAAMSKRTNNVTLRQNPSDRVIVPPHPSSAARRLPQLRRRQALPAEGMLAGPVLLQVPQPLDCLLYRRPMSGRHPPHDEIALIHPLEPLVAAAIEAFVHGLPHEALKRFGAVPYRKVDRHARVAGERAGLDSASAVV